MDTRWVDPQLLCSERNASVNGRVGPFGLLVLASNDLSEQTAVFFHILKAHKRYVVLMCSDQSRSNPCHKLSIFKHFEGVFRIINSIEFLVFEPTGRLSETG